MRFNRNFARIGELDRVADEIDQDLRQAASVAVPGGNSGASSSLNASFLSAASGTLERAADGLGNILNRVIGEFEDKLSGLDLGQVKHVIDQSEQMPPVGLKPFEYAKHFLGWLAVSAVRHQFGIAKDGIERRA